MKITWEEWYQLATVYYEKHHDLLVPRKYKTKNGYEYEQNGYSLGAWISNQRQAFKNRGIPKEKIYNTFVPLTDDQVSKLEKIGMVWVVFELLGWEEWYELSNAYYKEHGDLLVPRTFKTKNGYEYDETGYNLGYWINIQRQCFVNINDIQHIRKNTCSPLSKIRISRLEDIGMIFELRKNKNQIKDLCKKYNINYKKYKLMLNKYPYKELVSKINFLNSTKSFVSDKQKLNSIFFMSYINIEMLYGISKKELIDKYYDIGKTKILKR